MSRITISKTSTAARAFGHSGDVGRAEDRPVPTAPPILALKQNISINAFGLAWLLY